MLFWIYPISLCVCYTLSLAYETARLRSKSGPYSRTRSLIANKALWILHILLCISILGTVIATSYMVAKKGYGTGWISKDYLSSTAAVGLFFLAGLLPDLDVPYTQSRTDLHMWAISVVFEISWLSDYIAHSAAYHPAWMAAALVATSSRILILFCLIVINWITGRSQHRKSDGSLEECNRLFNENTRNGQTYGTLELLAGPPKKVDAQSITWIEYLFGFRKLIHLLWPKDSKLLQARVGLCFALLLAQRAVNIATPHQLGVLVRSIGPGKLPHKQILMYVLFRGLQGQQGVIGSLRALLWIPIGQATYKRLSSAAFEHVLLLSLDFHLSKRVGEVISALSKGSALNTFLDSFIFQLFPMVADLWIAAAYFFLYFNAYYSLMIIATTWLYIYITIYMAKYRGRARREMARREREMEAAKTDALLSYETVHYSGAVVMEKSRYEKLIDFFQKAEYQVVFSLNVLNAIQNGIFTFGALFIYYLNIYEISISMEDLSMFVTLVTYFAQLQAPLNFFGSFYTQVQNNLVDAERMLELFEEKPLVVDSINAEDLRTCHGGIEFSRVSFSYNGGNQALREISFKTPPGTSTAIVGESGSGKSTIFKLLFRFYDTQDGHIKIDGFDIRDTRLESFRCHIGVVPQDTVLFNDTIMYNLLYANPQASEDQVHEACKAASIHHMILALPHGYSTVVGERGLKLSGGERQRISIARAILRSPKILLLDEATSSLDSETERQIQWSLEKVAEGRTTITVAHRLSTIVKADQIIVLRQGSIVERGTHTELLANGGHYALMWRKQTETDTKMKGEDP